MLSGLTMVTALTGTLVCVIMMMLHATVPDAIPGVTFVAIILLAFFGGK